MLLALDSATRQAGLALYDGDQVRVENTWVSSVHHTEWLAPAVERALQQIGASAADLTAIAVTKGPGSFTGLRVAMSLAKGLAAARGLPLIGLPTLDVMAYPHVGLGAGVMVLLQAGRGRHAFAYYDATSQRAALAGGPPTVGTVEAVGNALAELAGSGPIRVVGELTPAERRFLTEQGGESVQLVPPALALRRPAVLAELAWLRLAAGESDDLHSLEPLYLQSPTTGAG